MNENLKIQALRESISNHVTNYEDKIADLRIEITVLSQRIEQLEKENTQLREQIEVMEDSESDEVVQGEVLD